MIRKFRQGALCLIALLLATLISTLPAFAAPKDAKDPPAPTVPATSPPTNTRPPATFKGKSSQADKAVKLQARTTSPQSGGIDEPREKRIGSGTHSATPRPSRNNQQFQASDAANAISEMFIWNEQYVRASRQGCGSTDGSAWNCSAPRGSCEAASTGSYRGEGDALYVGGWKAAQNPGATAGQTVKRTLTLAATGLFAARGEGERRVAGVERPVVLL